MAYFPMFVNLQGQPCLIVGGGKVALRKVRVLQDFGAEVTVAAPGILEEIRTIPGVTCLMQDYHEALLDGRKLVVAATDDAEQNRIVSKACEERGIPVNAVDQIEDCSFIFPSYLRRGELVAAFSSSGKSPVMTQYLKEQMEPVMTEAAGELTDYLGSIRNRVKEQVDTEARRRDVYRQVLEFVLEKGSFPDEEKLEGLIRAAHGLINV